MRRSPITFVIALGAALASASVAHATPMIFGSDSFTFKAVASTGNIQPSSVFHPSGGLTGVGQSGLSVIPAGTPIFETNTFSGSTTMFVISFGLGGEYGKFTLMGTPTLLAASVGSSSAYSLQGMFVPGSADPGVPENDNIELNLSFTQTGASYSGNGTFDDPIYTPEPSSLLLMGTGLLGIAFTARRRFSH